ncbi:MAG: hypothetical protein QG658_440 [Patescibacteria group bacterium]|nr:hypothetical protein [Patescibacteria group bacterium]
MNIEISPKLSLIFLSFMLAPLLFTVTFGFIVASFIYMHKDPTKSLHFKRVGLALGLVTAGLFMLSFLGFFFAL